MAVPTHGGDALRASWKWEGQQPSLTAMGFKLGQWVERTSALLPGTKRHRAVHAGASWLSGVPCQVWL